MAGEVIKGSVYLNNLAINSAVNPNTPLSNVVAGENLEDNKNYYINSVNNLQDFNTANNKLAVSLTKQFQLIQVRFDAGVSAGNVANIINDRINEWIGDNGKAYDDFQVIINPSGVNHDITTIIVRYY